MLPGNPFKEGLAGSLFQMVENQSFKVKQTATTKGVAEELMNIYYVRFTPLSG